MSNAAPPLLLGSLCLLSLQVSYKVGWVLLLLVLQNVFAVPAGMFFSCSLESLVPNSTNLAASNTTIVRPGVMGETSGVRSPLP